jgi:hypothetical protein
MHPVQRKMPVPASVSALTMQQRWSCEFVGEADKCTQICSKFCCWPSGEGRRAHHDWPRSLW